MTLENNFENFGAKKKNTDLETIPNLEFSERLHEIDNPKNNSYLPHSKTKENMGLCIDLSSPRGGKSKLLEVENLSPSQKIKNKKTVYDMIATFYLVKKFVGILRSVSSIREPKFMNETHFSLIGDPSFFYSECDVQIEKKRFYHLQKIKKQIAKIASTEYLPKAFQPFSLFILFWDAINLFLFLFFFIIFPVNLSFGINILNEKLGLTAQGIIAFKTFMIVFYVLDILVNCNTGYFEKGELVIMKSKIISKYMHKIYWIDLICLIIISLEFSNWSFIYFLKFFKIMKISQKFEELMVVDQFYFNVLSLILLLFRLIVVTHIGACVWHGMAAFQIQEGKNASSWLSSKQLLNEDWSLKYLYSFYYILITMTTVGYGDITPQNEWEVLFCVAFVFLACMMFAYCINCVGTIFQDFYKRESEFKKELFAINDYMRAQNIPKELQMRIRMHLEYLWKEEKIFNQAKAQDVLHKLSDSLKNELLLEVNGPIIKNVDLFSKNFSEKTLRKIIKFMKEEKYTPGDIIFNQGDHENKDLFLIKKGCVHIFVENELNDQYERKVLKELKEGQIFGEIAFFSEMNRTASARSTEFTTLIRIDQIIFKKLIEENDADREKFHHIKDMIRLYKTYDGIFLTCYACNNRNHLIFECPLLHRSFLKNICIGKYSRSVFQERNENFSRKRKKTSMKFILNPKTDSFFLTFQTEKSVECIEREDQSENHDTKTLIDEGLPSLELIPKEIFEKNLSVLKDELILQSALPFEKMTSYSNSKLQKHFINEEKTDTKLSEKIIRNASENFLIKKNKDQKKEENLEFDCLKSYIKYFPMSNVCFVLNAANKKLYHALKKKRKAYLFEKNCLNNTKSIQEKLLRKLTKVNDNSPKRNVLRKSSVAGQTWREMLKIAQNEKILKRKREKFKCFKKFGKFLANLFFWKKKLKKIIFNR